MDRNSVHAFPGVGNTALCAFLSHFYNVPLTMPLRDGDNLITNSLLGGNPATGAAAGLRERRAKRAHGELVGPMAGLDLAANDQPQKQQCTVSRGALPPSRPKCPRKTSLSVAQGDRDGSLPTLPELVHAYALRGAVTLQEYMEMLHRLARICKARGMTNKLATLDEEMVHLILFQKLAHCMGQMDTVPKFSAVFNSITVYHHGQGFSILDAQRADSEQAQWALAMIKAMRQVVSTHSLSVCKAFLITATEFQGCSADRLLYIRLVNEHFGIRL
jgi:hypothetical protein